MNKLSGFRIMNLSNGGDIHLHRRRGREKGLRIEIEPKDTNRDKTRPVYLDISGVRRLIDVLDLMVGKPDLMQRYEDHELIVESDKTDRVSIDFVELNPKTWTESQFMHFPYKDAERIAFGLDYMLMVIQK